jgi:hypothetical protein
MGALNVSQAQQNHAKIVQSTEQSSKYAAVKKLNIIILNWSKFKKVVLII